MNRFLSLTLLGLCSLLFFGCGDNQKAQTKSNVMNITDHHSFAQPEVAKATHLNLDISIDFLQKKINGIASFDIETSSDASEIIFDTRGLEVLRVTLDNDSSDVPFALGSEKKHMGRPLTIKITSKTKKVNIEYSTHPEASALDWTEPRLTAGKVHPALFTQSQAILARTWIPCQDSPGIRFTYKATVSVPKELIALMSASNPKTKSETGKYVFEMKQPIPAYLMALAVGDFEFKAIGSRSGVYAEPSVLDKSVFEFSQLEEMLMVAEKLYGAYQWERYDLIVLPPSFPFGGMENPRLTFVTPTILAGDRSLTSLIAHELAHSWSGNLVTNANWDDFWLNEGFTVYFERRIMEEIEDPSYADMLAVLGYQDLEATIADLGANNPDTHLKLSLENRDPDDGMTDIAYEKGYFFLRMLEKELGRDKIDAFLKNYFTQNAFKVMTTEVFLEHLQKDLFAKDTTLMEKLKVNDWVYGPGIPANCPMVSSKRFSEVDAALKTFLSGNKASELETKNWTTHEWLHFIRHFPLDIKKRQLKELDKTFSFSSSGNYEILAAWFIHTIRNNYSPAAEPLDKFLTTVGRRKFLKPLYSEMTKNPKTQKTALDIYEKARDGYHSVSVQTLDEILNWSK